MTRKRSKFILGQFHVRNHAVIGDTGHSLMFRCRTLRHRVERSQISIPMLGYTEDRRHLTSLRRMFQGSS